MLVSFIPDVHSQNLIKDFPGIPVIASYWFGYDSRDPHIYDSMKAMGVNIFIQGIDDPSNISSVKNKNMKLIAINNMNENWIQYYTDAKYSVWKTVGTLDNARYLQHDPLIMEVQTAGLNNYIRLKSAAACSGFHGTLIWSPFYNQELIHYVNSDDIQYRAEFNLKLENNFTHQDSTSFVDNPISNDTLCILQVTKSQQGSGYNIKPSIPIKQLFVKRSDFPELNQFKTFLLDYKLKDELTSSLPDTSQHPTNNGVILRTSGGYIQFKVIWTGNPNYLLSIDSIIISDQRGRDLKNPSSNALAEITKQVNNFPIPSTDILGWLGIDEPDSFDDYEPMRIVDSLINNLHPYQSVFYPIMGKWDGAYESRNNPWGTYMLSPWKEISKRLDINKINIIQDYYYLDYPYQSNTSSSDGKTPCSCIDFRAKNIDIAGELNYKQAYNLNHNFGVSLQCGCIHNAQAVERDIEPCELKYEANLAMLYGAKFLSLYTYFAERKVNDLSGTGTVHAIIDTWPDYSLHYTTKYYMFYDTLKPRLTGLFGKTIKSLIPVTQHVGSDGINITAPLPHHPFININLNNNQECLAYINPIKDVDPQNYYIDYGYFKDSTNDPSRKYFMIINRYYSAAICHEIGLSSLTGYTNWNLTNYSDTVSITIQAINGNSHFIDTIYVGDAGLYSVMPVVKYGGVIKYDETISGTNTLNAPMIIKSGSTLTVNGTYNINANITVEHGANLLVSPNGLLNTVPGISVIR
ncbi:MAG: hypothetical protein P4L35_13885 [Ignavibacteriaceae bacterium]|nr:hypothetical protein [Ignavibacteriaceae bacterium]